MMSSSQQIQANFAVTPVEGLVALADRQFGRGGFSLRAIYPDGSMVEGPLLGCGPNYAVLRGLPVCDGVVNVRGADLSIVPGTQAASFRGTLRGLKGSGDPF